MGRIRRSRRRKILTTQNTNLNQGSNLVDLKKWMYSNNFLDPLNLQLRNFSNTGRGITSKKSVQKNDVLIKIPFDLLISYKTVKNSKMLDSLVDSEEFTMHEILAFFLLIEKHKQEKSIWKYYINTLPCPEPSLPWSSNLEELKNFPNDLKITAEKLNVNFHESYQRLKKSIIPSSLCECCKKPLDCVLELNLFKWSYVMVNTRAVYVDPYYYSDARNNKKLSDEPSMALCPFLDMFNHDCYAQTAVNVVQQHGKTFYELRTLQSYQKYEQFFISYGAHDNEKLVMEYGFFIPGNIFDSVKFSFEEVVDVLNLKFNKHQFTFLKNTDLMKDLYVSNIQGLSFNLKAVIFVADNPELLNYSSVVFSDYPEAAKSVTEESEHSLVVYKYKFVLKEFDYFIKTDCLNSLVGEFLEYRVESLRKMCKNKSIN